MKRKSRVILLMAAGLIAAVAGGCRSQAPATATGKVHLPVIGGGVQAMPPAIVYQVSGESMNLVPVTLTADGRGVLSYPAPSDLNESRTPIDLGDGWWLDRRGIGPGSVFTTYTYEQYAAMKQAPSPQELMAHIDRNVRIVRMVALPVTAAEAESDPAVARACIEGGFAGCEELLNRK